MRSYAVYRLNHRAVLVVGNHLGTAAGREDAAELAHDRHRIEVHMTTPWLCRKSHRVVPTATQSSRPTSGSTRTARGRAHAVPGVAAPARRGPRDVDAD